MPSFATNPDDDASNPDKGNDKSTCLSYHRRKRISKLRIRDCPNSVCIRVGASEGNPGRLMPRPCYSQRCLVCGPAIAMGWAEDVCSVPVEEGERLLFVTFTTRIGPGGMTIDDSRRGIMPASAFSIRALRRSVAGQKGRKAWPGVVCEYALVLDVTKNGALHRQGIIRVSALQGSEMPTDTAIARFLRRNFNIALHKVLARPFNQGEHLLGGVYCKPVRDFVASIKYHALAEGRHWQVGKEWAFAPGMHRLKVSHRYFR